MGIPLTQERIIVVLKEHGELSIKELQEEIPLATATLQHELFRLRRKGMVEGRYVYRLKEQER